MEIHLLGQPSVVGVQSGAAGARGRKAWSLLAFLLLADAPVARERLATLLFGDADDPLGALRWNLAEVRRLLGPGVVVTGDPVTVELPADAWVDVRVLTTGTWVQASQVPGIGRELIEGISVQADPAFEAWLLAERLRLSHLSAAVLREAATARLAAGQAEAAMELATKLVAIDEFDEESQIVLVQAHRAAGGAARAGEYLAATIDRLERDLGVAASDALRHAADETRAVASGASLLRGTSAIESLIAAGKAAVGAGVFDAGVEILNRSVADARAGGERALEARALAELGTAFVHGGTGRDTSGVSVLHAALAIAEEIDAADLVAETTRELGYADMKRGRYERAEAWLGRSSATAPDRERRASATAVRGVVAADRGFSADSLRWLGDAAEAARDLDKPRLEAWTLAFMGRTHLLREEHRPAHGALERSVELARAAGWISFLPFPQALLATVELAQGEIERASAAFEAAFTLGCQIADPCWEGVSGRGVGLVHAAEGRIEEAIRWLDDARTRCMRIADSYLWVHAYCLDALCSVAAEHRPREAAAWISDLETVAARTGMGEMLVRAHLHRASLGESGAIETAALFAARIDNPAVQRMVAARAAPPARLGAVPLGAPA